MKNANPILIKLYANIFYEWVSVGGYFEHATNFWYRHQIISLFQNIIIIFSYLAFRKYTNLHNFWRRHIILFECYFNVWVFNSKLRIQTRPKLTTSLSHFNFSSFKNLENILNIFLYLAFGKTGVEKHALILKLFRFYEVPPKVSIKQPLL